MVEEDSASKQSNFDSGDTAWTLATSALVLFMTIPGLGLYYGGMVKVQNVLAVAMQSLSIACLITFLWLCIGYSLSFAPVDSKEGSPVIGDASRMWLLGMDPFSFHMLAPTVPEAAFCVRELTFAIITPSLISGSFASRMKYRSMLLFIGLWHIFVYCPLAHSLWHPAGFLNRLGSIDYAGGCVVHVASGTASLASALVVGNKGFGTDRFEPHNILLTFMGACMLWVGWYGFNAGSTNYSRANYQAGYAMLSTQICSSMSALSWMITESIIHEYPTILGIVSGAIAGLVVITPGAGYVDQTGAFVMGVVAGPLCYFGVQLKHKIGFEDALDAFGTHAIGGVLGSLMVGLFARKEIGGTNGAFYGNGIQFVYQLVSVGCTIAHSAVMTSIILFILDRTIGIRAVREENDNDLDASVHGSHLSPSVVANASFPIFDAEAAAANEARLTSIKLRFPVPQQLININPPVVEADNREPMKHSV